MTEQASAPEQYPGVAGLIHKHLPKVPFTASRTQTDVDLQVDAEHLLSSGAVAGAPQTAQ